MASEIVSIVCRGCFNCLKKSPRVLALPDLPAPASFVLEKAYYPDEMDVKKCIVDLVMNDR
jgi:pyruvate/2-oxoglutarate/acetoin dehydrogenase E1 component